MGLKPPRAPAALVIALPRHIAARRPGLDPNLAPGRSALARIIAVAALVLVLLSEAALSQGTTNPANPTNDAHKPGYVNTGAGGGAYCSNFARANKCHARWDSRSGCVCLNRRH
jgi:hypothetical protein